jgi:hypothetical protein
VLGQPLVGRVHLGREDQVGQLVLQAATGHGAWIDGAGVFRADRAACGEPVVRASVAQASRCMSGGAGGRRRCAVRESLKLTSAGAESAKSGASLNLLKAISGWLRSSQSRLFTVRNLESDEAIEHIERGFQFPHQLTRRAGTRRSRGEGHVGNSCPMTRA